MQPRWSEADEAWRLSEPLPDVDPSRLLEPTAIVFDTLRDRILVGFTLWSPTDPDAYVYAYREDDGWVDVVGGTLNASSEQGVYVRLAVGADGTVAGASTATDTLRRNPGRFVRLRPGSTEWEPIPGAKNNVGRHDVGVGSRGGDSTPCGSSTASSPASRAATSSSSPDTTRRRGFGERSASRSSSSPTCSRCALH